MFLLNKYKTSIFSINRLFFYTKIVSYPIRSFAILDKNNSYIKKNTIFRFNNQKIFSKKKLNKFFLEKKYNRNFRFKFVRPRSLATQSMKNLGAVYSLNRVDKRKRAYTLTYIKDSNVTTSVNFFFLSLINYNYDKTCDNRPIDSSSKNLFSVKVGHIFFYTTNFFLLNFTIHLSSLFLIENLKSFNHLLGIIFRKNFSNGSLLNFENFELSSQFFSFFQNKKINLFFYKKNKIFSKKKNLQWYTPSSFFFKKFPFNFFKISYYFNNNEFQSKRQLNELRSKLTIHPVQDFNAASREAFFYTITLHQAMGVEGEDLVFSNKKTKGLINQLFNPFIWLNKIKKSSFLFSNFKKPSLISNFFFYSGKNTHVLKKNFRISSFYTFASSNKKNLIKNKSFRDFFSNIFFFDSFKFSSKFFFYTKSVHPTLPFSKLSNKPLSPNFAKFRKNGLFNFSNKIINLKKISNFSFFVSNKEIFFFIFSKPFFFKFFFWNFRNVFKKNFLHSSSISFYFSNLYRSFFQNNKNFQYSNIIPQGNVFVFKYKRFVHRDFSSQIIDMALTNFFCDNISYFLEYCCGKKIMFNNNSFLMTYLDFDERASCALWTPRIRVFRKMLGPRLFLNESLTILYICIKLKDPYLLSAWLLNLFYKISFWKYKLLFRYLYYVLKYFMWTSFANKYIKGLRFQLKGKVSVAGNARTRTVFTSIGATGNGNLNKRVLTNLNLLKTFTGVISFRTWLSF